MPDYLRNIAAILLGLVLGSLINIGLIMAGSVIIPAPEGVDVTDAASIAAAIDQYGPEQFLTPFLAHALGTLVGALSCYLIAASHRHLFAFLIGGFFFAGGVMVNLSIPGPIWFVVLDLVFAYFPMAFLGILLAGPVARRLPWLAHDET